MEKAAGGGERKGKEREVTAAAICGRRGATRRNPPIKWDAWRLLIVTAARWHHRSAPLPMPSKMLRYLAPLDYGLDGRNWCGRNRTPVVMDWPLIWEFLKKGTNNKMNNNNNHNNNNNTHTHTHADRQTDKKKIKIKSK